MSRTTTGLQGIVLNEELQLSLSELTRLCGITDELVGLMVDEGLLHPRGRHPKEWSFSGIELRRARRALRLQRELELNLAGAALALDLLDEVEALRARIRALECQLGIHDPRNGS
jgi:chaperone modulatory protein CbpM